MRTVLFLSLFLVGLRVVADDKVVGQIVVEGKSFEVRSTAKGANYVLAVSKTGSEYKVWVGEKTNESVENYPVRMFKSGTRAIFKLSKTGYPVAVYLRP